MIISIRRYRIASSDIATVGYDAATNTLDIEFYGTGVYRYYSVPPEVHVALVAAKYPHAGKYFLMNIKGKYAWDPHSKLFPNSTDHLGLPHDPTPDTA